VIPKHLNFKDSFRFPIATPEGRRDMLIGGLLVLVLLPIGWVINLGARLEVVHRLYNGDQPYFRGFQPLGRTFRRGCISALAIFCYLLPANLFFAAAAVCYARAIIPTTIVFALMGFLLFVLAVFTLPGCMTVYACELDTNVLRDPVRAFRRAWAHRAIYCRAWVIALSAILLSFAGLLFFVVGFFVASVWAWEVVGYAFTVAMYANEERAGE
jgi:hypothetical protein